MIHHGQKLVVISLRIGATAPLRLALCFKDQWGCASCFFFCRFCCGVVMIWGVRVLLASCCRGFTDKVVQENVPVLKASCARNLIAPAAC